jgi:hypothetical protein
MVAVLVLVMKLGEVVVLVMDVVMVAVPVLVPVLEVTHHIYYNLSVL